MKKKEKIFLIIVLIMIIVSPLLVAVFVSMPILERVTSNNDWIDFWGGYIGALLGGVITLYVLLKTLESAKEDRLAEEKSRFFKELIELVSSIEFYQKQVINEIIKSDGDWNQKILEYNMLVLKIEMLLEIEKGKKIYKDIDSVDERVKDLLEINNELMNLTKIHNTKPSKVQVTDIFNSLCLKALYDTVEKFVIKNVNK